MLGLACNIDLYQNSSLKGVQRALLTAEPSLKPTGGTHYSDKDYRGLDLFAFIILVLEMQV